MRSLRLKTMVVGVAALGLTLAGCGLGGGDDSSDVSAGSVDPDALKGASLAVGSKEFDEQLPYWLVLRPDSLRQPAVAAVADALRRRTIEMRPVLLGRAD